MIKITLTKENNELKQIRFQGHAMYDDFGKDIVCAGVSSILTTTVNAILKFSEDSIWVDQKKDVVLTIKKSDEITLKLLENMLELLKELEESYPESITIRERD